jgi:hypothetical protein
MFASNSGGVEFIFYLRDDPEVIREWKRRVTGADYSRLIVIVEGEHGK